MSRHHHGARIRDIHERGRRVLVLENELIRVELLPDKGSDIVSFLHKPSDTDALWHSAIGLRRPAEDGRRPADDLTAFMDLYEGGWQECFPNGGPGVTYRGAPIPFHGELWAAAWDVSIVEDTPERVSVLLTVETARTPFRVEKRLTLASGRAVLVIDETIENTSATPFPVMWGHHPAFGAPFIDETCRIDLPPATGATKPGPAAPDSVLAPGAEFAWPHAPRADGGTIDLRAVPGPDARRSEWASMSGMAEGWYGVTSARRRVGFGMRWDVAVFPYLWFWQVWGGGPDYPWWGREYDFALEPWTSRPDAGLLEAIANGTARTIAGGERLSTRLLAVMWDDRDGIAGIDADGTVR
ncbi:MAG: aldose 1-epimerase [Chloroflexota bacterium]